MIDYVSVVEPFLVHVQIYTLKYIRWTKKDINKNKDKSIKT